MSPAGGRHQGGGRNPAQRDDSWSAPDQQETDSITATALVLVGIWMHPAFLHPLHHTGTQLTLNANHPKFGTINVLKSEISSPPPIRFSNTDGFMLLKQASCYSYKTHLSCFVPIFWKLCVFSRSFVN